MAKAAAEEKVSAGLSSTDAAKRKALLDWSEKVGVRQSAVGNTADETLATVERSKKYWEKEATEANKTKRGWMSTHAVTITG